MFLPWSNGLDCSVYGHSSRRGEAIEAGRIMCPRRIAEKEQSIGESEGLHWQPTVRAEIRRCFHHQWDVRCSGNFEAKSVCPHTKAAIGDLDLWIPKHRRPTGESGMPASGAGQIINRRI